MKSVHWLLIGGL